MRRPFRLGATFLASVATLATTLAGCAVEEPDDAASEDAIRGGQHASEPELRAVGKLVSYGVGSFCSATLIAPRVVLTAKHCLWGAAENDFVTYDFWIDGKAFGVARHVEVGRIGGGYLGIGHDAALLLLAEAVPESVAKPLAVRPRPLDASDEGKKLVVVGYGGTGTRKKGQATLDATSGRPYERAFASGTSMREYLRKYVYVTSADAVDWPGYELSAATDEVHAGLAPGGVATGDAQTCSGDSGGPLLERTASGYQVVGLTTGGEDICLLGGVYTRLGPDVQAVIARATSVADPREAWACAAAVAEGASRPPSDVCEGNTSVRCVGGSLHVERCEAPGPEFVCVAGGQPAARCQRAPVAAPVPALDTAPATIRQVEFGGSSACFLRASGSVDCQGHSYKGRTHAADGVVQLSTGTPGYYGLRGDGSVLYWGPDTRSYGQRRSAAPVTTLPAFVEISGQCGRTAQGTVVCWDADHRPTPVAGLVGATQIAASRDHACARLTNGRVQCWGDNQGGALGLGFPDETAGIPRTSATPVEVPGLAGAVHVAVGEDTGCAVLASGAVTCWGAHTGGCAPAKTCRPERGRRFTVEGLTDAVRVVLTRHRTCAIRRGGRLSCWGDTGYHGTPWQPDASSSPVEITELDGVSDVALSNESTTIGSDGACALTERGHALDCWGIVRERPNALVEAPRTFIAPVRVHAE